MNDLGAISLGCELQPILLPRLLEFKRDKLMSHLQVTIPNTLTFFQAMESIGDLSVIAHCNILNTFGKNEWAELKPWVRQIRSLRPQHVVEHFTSFRSPSGEKTGILFEPAITIGARRQVVVDSINRWQDLLGLPLCLENVPISKDIEAYFDFLLEIKSETGCGIACDLPHFFLSMFSGKRSESQMRSLAADLDPTQLHVGGLSLSPEGTLRDNHKLFSPWVLSQGRLLFPTANFITLEQNHQVPPDMVAKQLKAITDEKVLPIPDGFYEGNGMSEGIANTELSYETALSNRYPEPVLSPNYNRSSAVRYRKGPQNSLEFYDKYLPFLSPLSILEEQLDDLSSKEVIQFLASMSRWSFSYLSWWNSALARTATAAVRYGEGETVHFERRFGADGISDVSFSFEETIRFSSKSGFWVEVTSPRLEVNNRDLDETIGDNYDARAV